MLLNYFANALGDEIKEEQGMQQEWVELKMQVLFGYCPLTQLPHLTVP